MNIQENNITTLSTYLIATGAKTQKEVQDFILFRQNPSWERRWWLGKSCFGYLLWGVQNTKFVNINIFWNTAKSSQYELIIQDSNKWTLSIIDIASGSSIATIQLAKQAHWLTQKVSSGLEVGNIFQPHSSTNLTSVIWSTRCDLFDIWKNCSFCGLNGYENSSRTTQDIIEALDIVVQEDTWRKMITFTTAIFDEDKFRRIADQLSTVKKKFPMIAIALECQPLSKQQLWAAKYIAQVDTLMIPLDFFSEPAQDTHIPGKKWLIEKYYWDNMDYAVWLFWKWNVTSNIIVGVEDETSTLTACAKMLEKWVIPEPLAYRDINNVNIQTNPGIFQSIIQKIQSMIQQSDILYTMQETKAGCTACGWCSTFTANTLKRKCS